MLLDGAQSEITWGSGVKLWWSLKFCISEPPGNTAAGLLTPYEPQDHSTVGRSEDT